MQETTKNSNRYEKISNEFLKCIWELVHQYYIHLGGINMFKQLKKLLLANYLN